MIVIFDIIIVNVKFPYFAVPDKLIYEEYEEIKYY